jgi:hypothetical protein
MPLKFVYPAPILLPLHEDSQVRNFTSTMAIALSPDHELVVVQELKTPVLWREFWAAASSATDLSNVKVIQTRTSNHEVLDYQKRLIRAFHLIINKGYIFLGLLYLDGNVFDKSIIEEGLFFKKAMKEFVDMQKSYRNIKKYPPIDKNAIKCQFIGKGENYFDYNVISFSQIAKTTQLYRGSFYGVAGLIDDILNFAILSQNITKLAEVGSPILDKHGRDNLKYLTKTKKFIPAVGFQFDYGLAALQRLPHISALELLPPYQKLMANYQKYLQSIMLEKESPFELTPQISVFTKGVEIKLKEPTTAKESDKNKGAIIEGSVENETVKLFEVPGQQKESTPNPDPIQAQPGFAPRPVPPPVPAVSSESERKTSVPLTSPFSSSSPTPVPLGTPVLPLEKASVPLPKPCIPLGKPSIPLAKPAIPGLEKPSFPTNSPEVKTSSVDTEIYQDVFAKAKIPPPKPIVTDQDSLSAEEMALLKDGELLLDEDSEILPVNFDLMTQDDIFRDLEQSLDAMSKLDELIEQDQAVSRIYYPPPTLLSHADQDGMEIGGSSVVLSMGTGRNLYMVPELKRMQMWGKFYKDLEGNPQIEDFIAMEEKDVESPQQLENMLQVGFLNIRKNNHLFLGIMEIEGNGFEKNVFDEFALEWEEIEKLMQIHIDRRAIMKYPKISEENWIEIRYFGKHREIFANNGRQGTLEIAEEISKDDRYSKGKMAGIVCVDDLAVYFFILGNNFEHLDEPEYQMEVDKENLQKMYDLIDSSNLTPVSWWKLHFGIDAFESLFFWEEIKDSVIVHMVKDNYTKYIEKLLETKHKEDAIRLQKQVELPKKE